MSLPAKADIVGYIIVAIIIGFIIWFALGIVQNAYGATDTQIEKMIREVVAEKKLPDNFKVAEIDMVNIFNLNQQIINADLRMKLIISERDKLLLYLLYQHGVPFDEHEKYIYNLQEGEFILRE